VRCAAPQEAVVEHGLSPRTSLSAAMASTTISLKGGCSGAFLGLLTFLGAAAGSAMARAACDSISGEFERGAELWDSEIAKRMRSNVCEWRCGVRDAGIAPKRRPTVQVPR
jgi:hypothetical protein